VLIGPNGGGKSALFDAILNFSMLSRGSSNYPRQSRGL
jgi:ABC-type Mn2+/Zn2+ transport system ATPase subunit